MAVKAPSFNTISVAAAFRTRSFLSDISLLRIPLEVSVEYLVSSMASMPWSYLFALLVKSFDPAVSLEVRVACGRSSLLRLLRSFTDLVNAKALDLKSLLLQVRRVDVHEALTLSSRTAPASQFLGAAPLVSPTQQSLGFSGTTPTCGK